MNDATSKRSTTTFLRAAPGVGAEGRRLFAAVDLGTNNCRLLIASLGAQGGIDVVESFSRIVRLGEGLFSTGRLDADAIERALAALQVCARKIERRGVVACDAVATQACRIAHDGAAFVERVRCETGLVLRVIGSEEEAALAVAGCRDLIAPGAEAALIVDVGGGSTELSWVEVEAIGEPPGPVRAWLSMPVGVVELAERFPEPDPPNDAWFDAMVAHTAQRLQTFAQGEELERIFRRGGGHLVGASGAITSLAALHLGLERYDRGRVDGAWLDAADWRQVVTRLMGTTPETRAEMGCIGPDRADLVLPGAAILQAVQDRFHAPRLRVADRGLREGLLLRLFARDGGPHGRAG